MGDTGERKAAGSAVGPQPAPVVESRIGEMQATALCDQRGIEIRVKLNVGFRFQGWLQEGLQCWDGRTAPSEQGELVAWLQRSCQALGEAASCYSASHHLTGAGVEGIDGQQQAGQASTAHA